MLTFAEFLVMFIDSECNFLSKVEDVPGDVFRLTCLISFTFSRLLLGLTCTGAVGWSNDTLTLIFVDDSLMFILSLISFIPPSSLIMTSSMSTSPRVILKAFSFNNVFAFFFLWCNLGSLI